MASAWPGSSGGIGKVLTISRPGGVERRLRAGHVGDRELEAAALSAAATRAPIAWKVVGAKPAIPASRLAATARPVSLCAWKE